MARLTAQKNRVKPSVFAHNCFVESNVLIYLVVRIQVSSIDRSLTITTSLLQPDPHPETAKAA